MGSLHRWAVSLLLGLTAGCASVPPPAPLRVGVTPNYEPLVFLRGGQLAGAEVDFALALGREIGRPVVFVSVEWEEQIPALQAGHTDIIMSGMTATSERAKQVAFTDPYLGNALHVLVRRDQLSRWSSAADACAKARRIGVLAETTSEAYVRDHCPQAERITVPTNVEAPALLKRGAFDAYVDDGWSISLLLSQDPDQLALAKGALQVEDLAWGVRTNDTQLLQDVNAALDRWRDDGSLLAVVRKWAPHIDLLE